MITWWQVLALILGQGLVVVTAVLWGSNIANNSRMRAVLDDRAAKWQAPTNDRT